MNYTTDRPEIGAPAPHDGAARVAVMNSTGTNSRGSAANLSTALAKQGKHVCLITADNAVGNKPAVPGQAQGLSLQELLAGRKVLAEILLDGPAGCQILSTGNTFSNFLLMNGAEQILLVELLSQLEEAFDYLIVETAADTDKGSLQLFQAAPLILLTITPEAESLTKAFSLLRALKRNYAEQPIHVIVEKAGNLPDAHGTFKKLQHAAMKYLQMNPHYLGYFPAPQPQQGSLAPDPHSDHYLEAIADRCCSILETIAPTASLSHHFDELRSAQKLTDESMASAPEADGKIARSAETRTLSTPYNPGGWHERLNDRIALFDAIHYAGMLAERESER
ncbi:MAG: hypothetical protein KDI49_10525 [Gammaproteobacteria bacterium]|nr:hypothetical protein [Gammaproteobacteria bacterium]